MLILSRSAVQQGAELSKYGGGWLATAEVCVERKGGRWAVEVKMDCLYTKEIFRGTNNKYYST